jgi:N-acetylmuramoyl-L-alanine amidase
MSVNPKDILIALDDGHGMETAGKRTPIFPAGSEFAGTFMHENEFNSAVVKKLDTNLKRCGFKTILVADGDEDVPLQTRTDLANKVKANLFISIHANAYKGEWGDWGGISTHIYGKGGEAEKLANIVQKLLIENTGLRDRGVCVDNFHVLRETDMPAILCENGFMDNLTEATLLKKDSYRQTIADSIAKGICAYYGVSFVAPAPVEPKVAIMGASKVTAEQMATFLLNTNPAPKLNIGTITPQSVLAFCKLYLDEGKAEGVRGDIAFCQSIHETGYFDFKGDVVPEQNNYAGIGTTGGGAKGQYFVNPQMGIRGQIQHLKAYASKDALVNTCVDPRFSLVTRGIAPNWTDLNGRWAVPGTTYGQSILKLYDLLSKVKPMDFTPPAPVKVKLTWEQILEKVSANPAEWKESIKVAVNAAKAEGDLGALEMFKFLPELIEKIYEA